MKRIVAVFLAVFNLVPLVPSIAGAQGLGRTVPRFANGNGIEGLAADMFENIVYLPVTINGEGPFTFVLDTGAGDMTAIDQSIAEAMGLRLTPVQGGGGAGEETVQINRVDSVAIAVAGLSFDPRTAFTIPLHRMDPHWGKRKDGLIGGELLSTLVTRIDYENERADFYDAASYQYSGPGEIVPVTVVDGYLLVEARVDLYGREEPIDAHFIVDTGVRLSLFNTPYSNNHSLAAQSPKTATGVTGFGIGGVSKGVVGRVRAIRIGSFEFENPVMDFSTDQAGALADTSFSGIIGADLLSRFLVVLDYSRSRMILEKNRSFDKPFEFDMSGLRFAFEGARFDVVKVFSVFDSSPGAEAGITAGDEISAIDGRKAGTFTREMLGAYLQREGKDVRLTVKRDGEEKDITIRLRRLV